MFLLQKWQQAREMDSVILLKPPSDNSSEKILYQLFIVPCSFPPSHPIPLLNPHALTVTHGIINLGMSQSNHRAVMKQGSSHFGDKGVLNI